MTATLLNLKAALANSAIISWSLEGHIFNGESEAVTNFNWYFSWMISHFYKLTVSLYLSFYVVVSSRTYTTMFTSLLEFSSALYPTLT